MHQSTILRAMLECAGERGYRHVSVEGVCARAGLSPAEFADRFSNKEDCFARAYAAAGERVYERLAPALAAADRRRQLQLSLEELAAKVEQRPALARGLLLEVRVAGQPALVERIELLDRLAFALDGAWGPVDRGRPEPTTTAIVLVGAIEGTFARALIDGTARRLRARVPELAGIVSGVSELHSAADYAATS